MRLGVDTYLWSERFTEQDLWILDKAKEFGCSTVDIAVGDPDCFPVDAVKRKLKETDIEVVTSIGLPGEYNLISPDPDIRKNALAGLKKLVDINIAIGSKILAGVIYAAWGYKSGKPRTEQEWEWSVGIMRTAAEYAWEEGELFLAVECVNRFETHFLNIAEDAIRYCEDVGVDNMKVHLDTFHMIREEKSFTEPVRRCGKKYLGYVHLCENDRGIPGTGLVPWKEFFSALKEIGYDGPAVIESFDPGFEKTNSICAIWRKFAESGEELAFEGLKNLRKILSGIQ
jgi:D-psicose/D-tagatose/L-ribulose 3-epimerase